MTEKRKPGAPPKLGPLILDAMRRGAIHRAFVDLAHEAKRDRAEARVIVRRLRRALGELDETGRRAALLKASPDYLLQRILSLRDRRREGKEVARLRDARRYVSICAKWGVSDWKEIPSSARGSRRSPGFFDVLAERLYDAGVLSADWNGRKLRRAFEEMLRTTEGEPVPPAPAAAPPSGGVLLPILIPEK